MPKNKKNNQQTTEYYSPIHEARGEVYYVHDKRASTVELTQISPTEIVLSIGGYQVLTIKDKAIHLPRIDNNEWASDDPVGEWVKRTGLSIEKDKKTAITYPKLKRDVV